MDENIIKTQFRAQQKEMGKLVVKTLLFFFVGLPLALFGIAMLLIG